MATFSVTWEAPEYEYYEKGVSWYWVSIIAAAVLVAFAVAAKNFLFGVFVVIAELLVIVWGNRPPSTVSFRLDDRGVAIGTNRFHAWSELESWSVDMSREEWAVIHFYPRERFKLPFVAPILREKIDSIRANVKPIVQEKEYEPSLFEGLERFARF